MALRMVWKPETAGSRPFDPHTCGGHDRFPEIRENLRDPYAALMTGPIRPGRHDDLAQLAAVEVAAGERFRELGLDRIADDPGPTVADLSPHLADGTIWVAELEGRLVGYATASVVDGDGHLDQVSVVPEAGGMGFGYGLITEVHQWARGRQLPAVTLTTFRDVAWNGPYYERFGYRALPEDRLGPELAAIRQAEVDAGLDVVPRVAMRLVLASTDHVVR